MDAKKRVAETQIPRPVSEWLRDGWQSDHAPTAAMIQASANEGHHARLRGFKFLGPGWYPSHRVLVLEVGEHRGETIYELRFYDRDPRPAFEALAKLPNQEMRERALSLGRRGNKLPPDLRIMFEGTYGATLHTQITGSGPPLFESALQSIEEELVELEKEAAKYVPCPKCGVAVSRLSHHLIFSSPVDKPEYSCRKNR